MHRTHAAGLSAAAIVMVAAFGLSGCGQPAPSSPTLAPAPSLPAAPAAAPLPSPDALGAVLVQLADTSIPAEQKVGLVQYATAEDQPALVNFGEALRANGFDPLSVTATDLAWAADPGQVTASVTIGSSSPGVNAFTFPMEFSPVRDTWQLSRRTADQLLPLVAAKQPPG